MTTFPELGVRARTLTSLAGAGIEDPKPIQTAAIPSLMAGKDAVMRAPTGSGKTLAFAIPLVERLRGHDRNSARALIVGPTRELAAQIESVIRWLDPGLRTALLIGGVGYGKQTGQLSQSADVIIGCPGRILDLAGQGALRLNLVEYLVLDEADEMFDQGFARDVEKIIALLPTNARRQTILASATMPAWVETMIARHLNAPVRCSSTDDVEPDLEHGLMQVPAEQKIEALENLIRRQQATELGKVIVFHRTKHGAKKLARELIRRGHAAGELQGNLSQNARDRAIGDFRAGRTTILVATNVAARGIDVESVGLVVNYELPETAQWLTHRVGRTARNGAWGHALTMLTAEDAEQWRKLRRLGAPDLRHIDTALLLSEGEWRYTAAPAPLPRSATTVAAADSGIRRRFTPRRRPTSGRPAQMSARPRPAA